MKAPARPASSTPAGRRAVRALIRHREVAELARVGRASPAQAEAAQERALRLLAAFVGQRADAVGERMREAARCRSAK